MGPVMNLALAVIVMAIVLYQGAPAPAFMEQPALVGSVLDQSALKAAGLQPGDHIVSVDGDRVATWEDFLNAVAAKSKRTVSLHVERSGKDVDVSFVPVGTGKYDLVNLDSLAILPVMHPQITSLQREAPAYEAGLRPGDVVMAAAGERDITNKRLIEVIKAHEGQTINLEIKRNGNILTVPVTPRKITDTVMIGAQLSLSPRYEIIELVLDALVDATEVPLPEGILKSEIDSRVHDAIHPFDHDEAKFAEFLEENGKTREEFDTEAREDAEKSVRVRLVLDELADDQEVTVEPGRAHRADRLPGAAVPDAAGGVRPADPGGGPAGRHLRRRPAQQGAHRGRPRGHGHRRVRHRAGHGGAARRRTSRRRQADGRRAEKSDETVGREVRRDDCGRLSDTPTANTAADPAGGELCAA